MPLFPLLCHLPVVVTRAAGEQTVARTQSRGKWEGAKGEERDTQCWVTGAYMGG